MEAQIKSSLESVVKRLQGKGRDLSPVFTKLIDMIHDDIIDNFTNYGRWSGETSNITIFSGGKQTWKQLAPSTIKAYRKKGYDTRPTLARSLHLKHSIGVQKSGATSIRITANMPYAAIHQFGGEINFSAHEGVLRLRKVGSKKTGYKTQFAKSSHKRATMHKFKVGAYKVVIPARPFITLTKEDLNEIAKEIKKYIFVG